LNFAYYKNFEAAIALNFAYYKNFEAAIALNFAYYNFCKTHGAIRMTPAMAAGIEKSHWTIAELVKNCGE